MLRDRKARIERSLIFPAIEIGSDTVQEIELQLMTFSRSTIAAYCYSDSRNSIRRASPLTREAIQVSGVGICGCPLSSTRRSSDWSFVLRAPAVKPVESSVSPPQASAASQYGCACHDRAGQHSELDVDCLALCRSPADCQAQGARRQYASYSGR